MAEHNGHRYQIEKLKGNENWKVWSYAATTSFKNNKDAWLVVNGELIDEPIAADATVAQQAKHKQQQVKFDRGQTFASDFFLGTISTEILEGMTEIYGAKEIWDYLKNSYAPRDNDKASNLIQDLFNLAPQLNETLPVCLARGNKA